MTVHIYVLIHTEAGDAPRVVKAIEEIEDVRAAELVNGAYDVIARVEADSLDEFASRVLPRIQLADGVIRTMTCPAVGLHHLWEERLEPAYAGR